MASSHAARARSIGKSLMGGAKHSAFALGTGVVAGIVGGMLAENVAWFQKYWYSMPILIGVVGHAIKQTTSPVVGAAMLGSAGTMGYYNYKLNRASVMASGGETKGVQDTRGPVEDYVASLRGSTPMLDTGGVQAPMRSSAVMSMQAAA